jgi:hypothetical protein
MKLEDKGHDPEQISTMRWKAYSVKHYQAILGGTSLFVHFSYIRFESEDFSLSTNCCHANLCLQGIQIPGQKCTAVIEITTPDVVGLMLVAVQEDNLKLK